MTVVIKTQGKAANPAAQQIIRTPGAAGYRARFIASHLPGPVGSQLTEWPSIAGTNPYPLKIANSAAASTSDLKIGEDNGIKHVHSPGGNTAENAGRLLGAHITDGRPATFAGVFKVGKGTDLFAGVSGLLLSRNTSGTGYYQMSGSLYTLVQRDGWIFLMMAAAADTSAVLRADDYEVSKTPGPAAAPTYGGVLFGSATVGAAASVREMIHWPRQLNRAERDDVHAYFRSQYSDIL